MVKRYLKSGVMENGVYWQRVNAHQRDFLKQVQVLFGSKHKESDREPEWMALPQDSYVHMELVEKPLTLLS